MVVVATVVIIQCAVNSCDYKIQELKICKGQGIWFWWEK
jgi:hypothetical protein